MAVTQRSPFSAASLIKDGALSCRLATCAHLWCGLLWTCWLCVIPWMRRMYWMCNHVRNVYHGLARSRMRRDLWEKCLLKTRADGGMLTGWFRSITAVIVWQVIPQTFPEKSVDESASDSPGSSCSLSKGSSCRDDVHDIKDKFIWLF